MSVHIDEVVDIVDKLRATGGAVAYEAAAEIERMRGMVDAATRYPAKTVMVIGADWSRRANLTSKPVVVNGVLLVHVDGDLPASASGALTNEQEIDAMRGEVAESLRTVMRYHKGNTRLLLALADLVEFTPDAMPNAVKVMSEAGLMLDDFLVDRAGLDQRKECPISWEVAVRTLVKQPDMQAHLLAMAEPGDEVQG